jgi:hypothetical protein
MEEKENESADLERLCQGVSPGDAPCSYPATMRCTICMRWFCDAHAEDEQCENSDSFHPEFSPFGLSKTTPVF